MPCLSFGAAMRRRDFIKVIGGAATWPLAARAHQTVHMRHIGILLYAREDRVIISPVLSALESLGYVDGQTVSIEYRDADGRYERLQEVTFPLELQNRLHQQFRSYLAPRLIRSRENLLE